MTEPITSPDNEKLKLVRKLADPRGRGKHGAFATEGEDLLEAGLAAGRQPRFVLAAAGAGAVAGAIEVEPELLDAVSSLGSGTRVIAVWPIPEDPPAGDRQCVFLDAVADPGNVGTIIRSATALGGARVVLGPGCADPYSPKAVRAAMGTVMANPPLAAGIDDTPPPRLALATREGAGLDDEIGRLRPRTLVLGAERDGISAEVMEACDGAATIPVSAGAESLNVAATAAIALQRISSRGSSGSGDAAAEGGS